MKKYILKNMFFCAIIGITLFLIPFYLLAKNSETINSDSDSLLYSPNEIIIQFKNNFNLDNRYRENFKNSGNAQLDSLNSLFRLTKILPLSPENGFFSLTKIQNKLSHTYLFQFNEKNQIQKLLKHYQALKTVQMAEPNYYYFFDGQKKLNISSSDKIQLDRAAQLIRHQIPVIIGIIDTGFDWNRKDLVANIWQNPVEKMDNKDNDGNGFVDDIWGANFVNFDSPSMSEKAQLFDSDGHGTYLSGLIYRIINYSAEGKNADINKLMILKAADKNSAGKIIFNTFSVSQAIIYAANNGANIVNFSACGKKPSQILKQAIDYAVNNNCTIIAAAGDRNSSVPVYPAAFDNVISVAATDFNDKKTGSSNFGHWIDIAAPGYFYDQISDTINAAMSGTAIATAQVAGLASLLLSSENELNSDSLKKRIIFSSENIYQNNPEFSGKLGAGRINAYRALNAQQKPNIVIQKIIFQNNRQNKKLIPGELVSMFVELKNLSFSAKNISIQLFSNNKNVHIINSEDFIPGLNFQAEYKNIGKPFKILIEKNIIPTPKPEIIIQIKADNDFSLIKNYPIALGVDQPINLRIENIQPVTLAWSANDNYTGYNIYRKNNQQNSFIKLNEIAIKSSNFIDNSTQPGLKYFYYITGLDSTGIESPLSTIDSVNFKQAPEFLFFPKNDSLAPADSILLRVESRNLSNKKIKVQWKINNVIVNNDSSYLLLMDHSSLLMGQDTIQVTVFGDQIDSSIVHSWFITKEKPAKKLIEYSFFPRADTSISAGDSIQFIFHLRNYSADSLNYQWFLNDSLMSVANDSLFIYSPVSDSSKEDKIRVLLSNEDTVLTHEWNVAIFSSEECNFKQLIFSPNSDTTIFSGDSLRLFVVPFSEMLRYRWVKDGNLDSTNSNNYFSFYAPVDSEGTVQILATLFSNDFSFQTEKEWRIKYILKTPTHEDIIYYPVPDTSIFEGDRLKLGVKFFYGEDSLMNFHWSVNNFIDSTDSNSSYLMDADFFSSGIDTVSLFFEKGDSLYKHQWIIAILNKNRPPQILSRTMVLDTTLTLDDQMNYSVEVFDPDNDSLSYSWALNSIVDSSASDSFYIYFLENVFSESDTLQLKISDADTSIFLDWIIRHSIKINHSPQIISATPKLDSILTKSDSIKFKISCFDADGDSLRFQWWRNNIIDSTAIDSVYFYYQSDLEQSTDSIRVLVFDGDTSIFAQWILFPDSTFDDLPISVKPIIFYPEMDTLFAEKDSLDFIISNLPDSINIQWSVNNRSDSSTTDSSFIYYFPDKVNTVDTIQVKLISPDSLFFHEWYIYYPELPVKTDSLRLSFFPVKQTIFYSTNDSLKFLVQLKAGTLSEINIHWFVNHELDAVNSDTNFFFIPDTLITRIDTITALITHSDTTIIRNWAIRYEPVLKLPAPVLLYPIEGNRISEFETLSWENDSSLAAIDSTTELKYVIQLSKDSTFSEIFSTDTCLVTNLPFNELVDFEKISIKAPIYWRVKLFLEQNKISEFINSPLPFYYFPMFVTLENFSGEKNEEGILLCWTTSYEANCAGFNILRSETPGRDFQKINDYLITGHKSYSWIDKIIQAGVTFYYKLEEITINGTQKFHQTISIDLPAPAKYSLSQNFPNPFNSTTSFKYQIPKTTHVLIEVFNILGKKVKTLIDERKDAGYYTIYWDGADDSGENVVSGIYFYIISADKFHATNKMIVVR